MKPPFAANLFPHLSPASPPSPPLSLRGKAITRDALGTRDGGFTERGPKVGEQGGPSCLSAFFDRERAKKKKGRGTHLFSSDLLAGVLWDIRARQWIVALVSPSGDRNRGRKAGLVGRKQRRRKRCLFPCVAVCRASSSSLRRCRFSKRRSFRAHTFFESRLC